MVSVRRSSSNDSSPIFIVGAPRSGTSLLRNILNRHPAIGLCDETYYFYYVYNRRRAFGDLRDLDARRKLVDRYLSTDRIKRLQIDLNSLSQTLMHEGENFEIFFLSLIRFYAKFHGKLRFGEKTPQHALYAEDICILFPDCKLIHIVRDPRDVVSSLKRMPWASPSVTANARNWVQYTHGGSRVRNQDNYLQVYYEELVKNPSLILMEICKFIGEQFDDNMLVPDDWARKSIPGEEWWFERANGPLDQDRVGVWKDELSDLQVSLVEWVAGQQMKKFGYKPICDEPSLKEKALSMIDEFSDEFQQKISHWGRLWYYWFQPTKLAEEEIWINRRTNREFFQ